MFMLMFKYKMLADWLIVLRLCLCQHVLTGHNSDISIRRTRGFDILMLMSRPSSLAHSFFYAYAFVASELLWTLG